MSVNVSFKNVASMEAKGDRMSAWLEVADARGNKLSIFMPFAAAQMLAETWAQHRDFVAPRTVEDFVPGLLVKVR